MCGCPAVRPRPGSRCATCSWPTTSGNRVAKVSRTKVLHSFGREQELDRAAIERLVGSLPRLLEPDRAAAATGPAELVFVGSRPLGGTDVLDGLWHILG